MESNLTKNTQYREWLKDLKKKIRQSQIKAAVSVNTALLEFYWELGADIVEKQKNTQWGSGFLKQLSHDLMAEFSDIKGFSKRNLERIRKWYLFYTQEISNCDTACVAIGQQSIVQLFRIPWGQNLVIVSKSKTIAEALFYVHKTIENNWSRSILIHQIESGFYERQGKSINNFSTTCVFEAAGEGINLQFCWYMINYDIPWNPNRLEQRMGRIHRYGLNKQFC